MWAAWKQTSDCCNGPVKERIYYERTCKNNDCECYGATTAVSIVNCDAGNIIKIRFNSKQKIKQRVASEISTFPGYSKRLGALKAS